MRNIMGEPNDVQDSKPDVDSGNYGVAPEGGLLGSRQRRLNERSSYPASGSRKSGRRVSRRHRRKEWIFRLLVVALIGVAVWAYMVMRRYQTAPIKHQQPIEVSPTRPSLDGGQ